VISLLAGKPHDAMFPFKSLSFNIASPADPAQEQSISLSGKDLAAGLQYAPTGGLPRLLKWFIGLQALSHGRKSGEGWSLSIGSGSQDLIYKVRISLNLNDGSHVSAGGQHFSEPRRCCSRGVTSVCVSKK
jgi:tryptophan aminotransferase